MKAVLPWIVLLGLLGSACRPSAALNAQVEALQAELSLQRQQLEEVRSAHEADRQTMRHAVGEVQSQLAELERTLRLASAEIWGDGSPTSARLAMAERTLQSARAAADALAASLQAGRAAR